MPAVEFSVALQGNKTPAEYVRLAQVIDEYAFDVVSVYNDLMFQPALGALLWMAPYLHGARRIGPAALNPYLVHPVEIAGQVALLDMATGGRAYLGLARGAWLDSLGVAQTRPITTLREAVLLVKHLLAGNVEPFHGQVFCFTGEGKLQYARVRGSVPITIGTWGTASARMAGGIANEIKIGGSTNPAMATRLRAAMDAGRRAAGRRAHTVGICLGAVTVVDEDRQTARDLARQEVARYLPVVARLDPSSDPEWLARLQTRERIADLSDEILDRFAFAGTPADIVHQVQQLFEAGATRVEFGTPLGRNPVAAVRLLGERVLPAFCG